MATADEYATWIVENKDKKGTPDFETVAKAYEQAKSKNDTTVEVIAPPPTTSYMGGFANELVGAGKGFVKLGKAILSPFGNLKSETRYDEEQMPVAEFERLTQQAKELDPIIRQVVQHPEIIGTAAKAEVKKAMGVFLAGGGYTKDQQEQWGENAVDVVGSLVAIWDLSKLAGKKYADVMAAKDIKKLMEAQKTGNKSKVNEILDSKLQGIKDWIAETNQIDNSNSEIVKNKINDHRARVIDRQTAHNDHVADLDRKIAEAKTALNTKREAELARIKKDAADAHAKSLDAEHRKIAELSAEHERVVAQATADRDAAKAASERLAEAEKLKLSSEETARLRRIVSKYNQRGAFEDVRIGSDFPPSDGRVGPTPEQTPLNARIVDAIQTRVDVENARIGASEIYKNFTKRITSLWEEGKIWGLDEKGGAGLRDKLRDMVKVKESDPESDFSSYMRQKASKLLSILEHTPEGVEGKIPVKADEALNILKELRDQQWALRQAGNVRSTEIKSLADDLENSLRSFVGEEFMPREQWAKLMQNSNELRESQVGQIAAGRKGGDYLPLEKQDRHTPVEKVEEKIFENSDRINSFRRLLRNDEEFYSFLDQYISNTLSGKTSAEISSWLKKEGKWVDEISEPSLRPRIETFAAKLEAHEGNATAAAKNLKILEDKITSARESLEKNLASITARSQTEIAGAEKTAQKTISTSNVSTVTGSQSAKTSGRAERARISSGKTQQTQALAEALQPEEAQIRELETARQKAVREGRLEKIRERKAGSQLKSEKERVKLEIESIKPNLKKYQSIVDDVNKIVFSNGSPVTARANFEKIKGQLVESQIMEPEVAEEISNLLASDAITAVGMKARIKAKATVAKWAAGLLKVGLGVGAYEAGLFTKAATSGEVKPSE